MELFLTALGMTVLWCVGLFLCFILPIIATGRFMKGIDGLSQRAAGVFFGKLLCATYVTATILILSTT